MAVASRILRGSGLATTRLKPCSPSCLNVKPFSRVSLHACSRMQSHSQDSSGSFHVACGHQDEPHSLAWSGSFCAAHWHTLVAHSRRSASWSAGQGILYNCCKHDASSILLRFRLMHHVHAVEWQDRCCGCCDDLPLRLFLGITGPNEFCRVLESRVIWVHLSLRQHGHHLRSSASCGP